MVVDESIIIILNLAILFLLILVIVLKASKKKAVREALAGVEERIVLTTSDKMEAELENLNLKGEIEGYKKAMAAKDNKIFNLEKAVEQARRLSSNPKEEAETLPERSKKSPIKRKPSNKKQ